MAVIQAQQIKMFVVVNPVGWPTVLAVDTQLKFDSKTTFTWEFPSDSAGKCVVLGRVGVKPCTGRAVDWSFSKAGKQTIKLTVKDAGNGLQNPFILQQDVLIPADFGGFQVSQRAEVRQLDNATYNAWIFALYRLKDLGIYDHLAQIHVQSFSVGRTVGKDGERSSAHASPSFLTWHRMSMRVTERCINVAISDDSFGMPYWDWQKGWQGMDRLFGPRGSPNNSFIVNSGPFCNDPQTPRSSTCPQRWPFPPDYPGQVKALARELGADPGFHFQTQNELTALLAISTYDSAPFNNHTAKDSFRSALEGWSSEFDSSTGFNHNGVHRWVGGTMGEVVVSFHDPLFLVHHSQGERLFTMWQEKYKCTDGQQSDTCYRPGAIDNSISSSLEGAKQVVRDGKQFWVLEGHMYGDVLFPWNVRNSDVLKSKQGYRYLDTNEKMPPLKSNNTAAPNATIRRSSADKLSLPRLGLVATSLLILL
jgi:hypothetical protein